MNKDVSSNKMIIEELAGELGYDVYRDSSGGGFISQSPTKQVEKHNLNRERATRELQLAMDRRALKLLSDQFFALAEALGYEFQDIEEQPAKVVAVKKAKK